MKLTRKIKYIFLLFIISIAYINGTHYNQNINELFEEAYALDTKLKDPENHPLTQRIYTAHHKKVLNTISARLSFSKCSDFTKNNLFLPTDNYILWRKDSKKPILAYCETKNNQVKQQEFLFGLDGIKKKYSIGWSGLGENYFYSIASKTQISRNTFEVNAPCIGANTILNKTSYIFNGKCKATGKTIMAPQNTQIRICATQLGQWDHKESILCTDFKDLETRLRFIFPKQETLFRFSKKITDKKHKIEVQYIKNKEVKKNLSCIGFDRLEGHTQWKFVRLCDNKEIVPLDETSKVRLCKVETHSKKCTSFQSLDTKEIFFDPL